MKKNVMIFALATLSGITQIKAGDVVVDVKVKVAVATCNRGTCPVTINAVGDKAVIDISKYSVTDLGTISQVKAREAIELPASVGDMKIYSFTPTEGDLANKKVFVAFENQKPRMGTRFAGQNLIKVHRRAADEKDWTEAGSISGEKIQAWYFDVNPNGDWKTLDPKSTTEVKFELGAGQLTAK